MDLQPLSQSAPRRPAGQGKQFNRRAFAFVIVAPVSAALLLLAVTWSLDAATPSDQAGPTTAPLVALDAQAVPPTPTAPTPTNAPTPAPAPAVASPAATHPPVPPAASRPLIAHPPSQIEHPRALTFNNRPLRPVKTLRMLTTAYSPDERSCGIFADGITASGFSVYTNGMALVAADTRLLPFGTLVSIPGYNDGKPVPVLDRGGAIKGKRLDLLYSTHERALQWGAQRLDVVVYEYADE